MFVTLRKMGAALGLIERAEASLADALPPGPNWSRLPLNEANLNADVRTLGRTGHEQTVRTGVFAMEGPNAPVLRIGKIVEEMLGSELTRDPSGKTIARKVTEPTLHAELVGNDGARKTLAFHATHTQGVFAHSTHDGAKLKPFFPASESGRGTVRLTLDAKGFPVELSVHDGVQIKASKAAFTGYGSFREPPPLDSFK